MAHHGTKMSELKDKMQHGEHVSSYEVRLEDDNGDREFWMAMVLHGADLANVAFQWDQCLRWARLVGTEFKAQVAKEKARASQGHPVSGFMNIEDDLQRSRHVPNLAKMQVGFGTYVVLPCFDQMAHFLPAWSELVDNLNDNIDEWKDQSEEGREIPAAVGNEETCMSFVKDLLL